MDYLRKKLEEKLARAKESRVSGEIEHLSGQFFSGGLIRTALKIVADVGMIVATLIVAFFLVRHIVPFAPCNEACFLPSQAECCWTSPVAAFFIVVSLGIIFAGSAVSTASTTLRTFQHSASLNVAILMAAGIYLNRTRMGGVTIAFIEVAIFLSVFYGYQFGLRFRR